MRYREDHGSSPSDGSYYAGNAQVDGGYVLNDPSSDHADSLRWAGYRRPGDEGVRLAGGGQVRSDGYGDGVAEHALRHLEDDEVPGGQTSGQVGDSGHVAVEPDPTVGRTGARFGPYSARPRKREKSLELPSMPDLVEIPPTPKPPPTAEPLPLESEVLIRPYARTGGRTRPTHDLALEALISTSSHSQAALHGSWEHRMIANLCARPHSVAEVAALLTIPLGVARILLADMAAAGTVVVHGSTTANPPDLILMSRVLAGLRRL